MAYWGELPPPKVHRGNSMRRNADRDLQVEPPADRNSSGNRLSDSTKSRQNRFSTQTDDTFSPFVSPTASSFQGDGLAPRPSSFQKAGGGTTYGKDYSEKRRQREERNRDNETYDDNPPPAAPDVPRAPPISYKQPHTSGSSTYAGPSRSRSTRKTDIPNTTGRNFSDEPYRKDSLDVGRRGSKGKAVDSNGDYVHERQQSAEMSQSRKGSISEAEAKRRREWAADRSPLQRLELTLDSITKEEKRARVEEAELLAKEGKNGRGNDRLNQNSVRFRNRPLAKGPDPYQPEVISSPEATYPKSSSPKENQGRSGREKKILGPEDNIGLKNGRPTDYQVPPGASATEAAKGSVPERGQSLRGPAAAAAAGVTVAGLGRSPSNKLRKDPPGDPWFNRRVNAEQNVRVIKPISPRDKELPPVPVAAKETSYPITNLDSESDPDSELDVKPVQRGNIRKIEQLTGEKTISQAQSSPQTGHMRGASSKSNTIDRSNSQRTPRMGVQTEGAAENGVKYGAASQRAVGGGLGSAGQHNNHDHHRFSSLSHYGNNEVAGQGVYVPSKKLDEWKNGGVVLLDGTMLDLDLAEKTEAEKDKAWWEAGNTTRRRRSTTSKHRKAEAYDGEYDDSTGPTRFKPKLFLKSGPLLRYCGLRQEKKQGRIPKDTPRPSREIWRGSVMIVTEDSGSSYDLAPTLRLFVQPMDLLPPPPAQVDGEMGELAPEYIDPLAGLPKLGRDGRTLYIRPVEALVEGRDISKVESDDGLFESQPSPLDDSAGTKNAHIHQHSYYSGEKVGKYKEIRGFRLHAERGVTFWKFNLEIELKEKQQRIAYRINRGPATGFWVPARDQAMNIMFHSCNGFSYGVDSNQFSGPDPMWRDVLNTHQTQPFHVMLGGGDQIYNDCVQHETEIFKRWTEIPLKHQHQKEHYPFTTELQNELEDFYLNRYSMWFSQGLFGVAVSQIPMINVFDDHDIIDGFGSYSDRYMRSPVMSGLGAVAFKYYMLFQHQSSIDEGEETEPSWILGAEPGPYIPELSRSIFTFLGRSVAFLGLDCRTERRYDEVISPETYDKVFARLVSEIKNGETKHLIVLLGVPLAYPRMVWLENILTSRLMEPVKAMSRAGLFGKKLLNHLDGGVEILDDLDDHWTAKHHKDERHFLIEELQDLAAEKSVRITILGGDVHLAAIGQFYSSPKLAIPKDQDHRYMPNIISSAIVNTPPPDTLADLLNKRNKIHHLDDETDENMIPIFTHDVTGKPRNNKRLLNRRNWCSIREYNPDLTPPPTPEDSFYNDSPSPPPKRSLMRRFSSSRGPSYRPDAAAVDRPPVSNTSFFSRRPSMSGRSRRGSTDSQRPNVLTRTLSLTRKDFMPGTLFRRNSKRRHDDGGINGYGAESDDEAYYDQEPPRSGLRGGGGGGDDEENYFPAMPRPDGHNKHSLDQATTSIAGASPNPVRREFHRTPTGLSVKQLKRGGHEVNLEGGLDICLNVEVNPKDPAGITMPYRLLVPRLWYEAEREGVHVKKMRGGMKRWLDFARGGGEGRWRENGRDSEEEIREVEEARRVGARGL